MCAVMRSNNFFSSISCREKRPVRTDRQDEKTGGRKRKPEGKVTFQSYGWEEITAPAHMKGSPVHTPLGMIQEVSVCFSDNHVTWMLRVNCTYQLPWVIIKMSVSLD